MSVLTNAEHHLLQKMSDKRIKVSGRENIEGLLRIIDKMSAALVEASDTADANAFMLNAFWLAATGKLSEAEIRNQHRLTDVQREDMLSVLQMRYSAQAWQATTVQPLQPLPVYDDVSALSDPVYSDPFPSTMFPADAR